MPAVIEARGLTKSYSGRRAVDRLDLSVQEGEIFGYLGPNGAGKTTTIRLMLNFIRPSRGKLLVLGHNPRRGGKRLRNRIGYLPGEMGLYESDTGEAVLDFYAGLNRSRAPYRRDLCDQLQMAKTDLRRKIKSYSKGMKQKIGLIQAMQHDPELVILDEPTGGLDPLVQDAFFDILRDLRRRGRTVFFSTHVLSEIAKVCDRVGVLMDGKLILVSSVLDLQSSAYRVLWVKPGDTQADSAAGPPLIPAAQFIRAEGDWLVYHVAAAEAQKILVFLAHMRPVDFRFESAMEESFLDLYRQKPSASPGTR